MNQGHTLNAWKPADEARPLLPCLAVLQAAAARMAALPPPLAREAVGAAALAKAPELKAWRATLVAWRHMVCRLSLGNSELVRISFVSVWLSCA